MGELQAECMKALRVKVLFFSDSPYSTWGPTRRIAVAEHRRELLEAETAQKSAKLRSQEEAKARAIRSGRARRFDKERSSVPSSHPRVLMATVFFKCLDAMCACEDTDHIFDEPVNREEFFDYADHCPDGVDLLTIRYRVEALVYGSTEEFQQDVNKIVHNSIAYNGLRNPITLKAKSMVEVGYAALGPELHTLSLLSEKARVYDIYTGVLKMLQLQCNLAQTEGVGEEVANAMLHAGGEASMAQKILVVAQKALEVLENDTDLRRELETGEIADVATFQARLSAIRCDPTHLVFLQSIVTTVTETMDKEDTAQREECDAYFQARLADPINTAGDDGGEGEEEEDEAEVNEEQEAAKQVARRETRKRKRELKKNKKKKLKKTYDDDEETKARRKKMDRLLGRGKEKDAEFGSSEDEETGDEGDEEEDEESED